MSKKFQKTYKQPKENTMTEEVKNEEVVQSEQVEQVQDVAEQVPVAEEQPEVIKSEVIAAENLQPDPIEDGTLVQAMATADAIVEAKSTPATADSIAEAAAEFVAAAAPSSDLSEEEAYLNKIRESGTPEQKRMLAAVETFAANMKPRVEIEATKGASYQVEFLDHLLWILKKDYETFRGAWNVLLVYFNLYHGVNSARSYTALSEFSTTRFLFAWTKGIDKCNCYRNLITLLRATRNKDTRKHDIKTINIAFIGPNVLTEVEMNNLKQFYGV